jgi:hypothetical protein
MVFPPAEWRGDHGAHADEPHEWTRRARSLREVRYFPDHGLAVAFQINTSVPRALGASPGAVIDALARAVLADRAADERGGP